MGLHNLLRPVSLNTEKMYFSLSFSKLKFDQQGSVVQNLMKMLANVTFKFLS